MRDLILYKSSYNAVVLDVDRQGGPNIQKLWSCNFAVNLKTGKILKDRYNGNAGKFLTDDALKAVRITHNYTPLERQHFAEELFIL